GADNYSPGGNTLSVAWQPPADDGGNDVAGYHVTYSSDQGDGGTIDVGADATSTLIQGVTDGATYTVSATAENRAGIGETSNSASAKPFSPPGKVTGVSAKATGSNGTAAVSWKAAAAHGRAIATYQ